MTTRCVKWSEEAADFWETAPDESVVLDIVVSYSCESQTGEGFEELINSLNSENIKRKIQKVNITDTSYLYRHTIPEFSAYSDPSVPTKWFLTNKSSIEKLTIDKEVKSWASGLADALFQSWFKKIKEDFAGDLYGSGILPLFREAVLSEANDAVSEIKGTLRQCIDFILEECAYTCAFFKNVIMVYPTGLTRPIEIATEQYGNDIRSLSYNLSNNAQRNKHRGLDKNKLNSAIIEFITNTNRNVNFFVISKNGDIIYKNESLQKIVSETNAMTLNPKTWEFSAKVMETKKQIVDEENDKGKSFLSVKAPLIIDGEVEGVIGLAIDITDRKKLEHLVLQKKLWISKKLLSEAVAHDVRSPLLALSMIADRCKNLPEQEHVNLRNAIDSIECILDRLLEKYENAENRSREQSDGSEERYICVDLTLPELVEHKKRQYGNKITFKCPKFSRDFIFVRGDYQDFRRMISNLLNNASEAAENVEGRKGVVEVVLVVKNRKVEIRIKDNGKGMPKEVADKIMSDVSVTSGKEGGHGIGMRQVRMTAQSMEGEMSIKSEENVGTEITLTFPQSDPPRWFANKIVLNKGDAVVVLDDDPSVFDIFKRRFAEYSKDVDVKCFTQGRECADFINSIEDKSKVFLLADYELREQGFNGVDVVEQTGTQDRHILITSVYVAKIKDFNEKARFIKMFPKSAGLEGVSIVVKDGNGEEKSADIVFVDDAENLTKALCEDAKAKGLSADSYASGEDFLRNLEKYPKSVKIVADYELGGDMTGLELAKKLHELGYDNLYLMSGRTIDESSVPPYLNVMLKTEDNIRKALA
jgi:signal transduction histidine kinase/FixJ family two-component response regulator